MSLNSMREGFQHSGKWLLGFVTVAMLVLSYSGIGSIFGQRRAAHPMVVQTPADVVATVNGQPITRVEYQQAYDQIKQEQQMFQQTSFGVLSDAETRDRALQQAIQQAEQVIVAKNAGIVATDADISKAKDAQLVQLRTQLGLPASASVDDINTALSKYNGAETVDDLIPVGPLRDQILIQKYQNQLKASSMPTELDMENYYKSVHARHILIGNKTRPDAQALNQAQQIIAKIKAGGDFVALAKQYSDDPGSKNKGGDDGFITENTQYVPEFLNAALALKAGETTPQPILSPQYGYFIIQAVAVKENYPADYQKNKAKYQQQVAQSMQSKAEQDALAKVAATAKIVVNDPLLRAFYSFSQPLAPGQTSATQQAAVTADLNKAAAGANGSDKPLIYAMLAIVAQKANDTKSEIADLNTALGDTDDGQLRMMLGDAYRKSGNMTDAMSQYAQASQNSYNDASVHIQLQQTYKSMHQPQLALKEGQLARQITQQQQSSSQIASNLGLGGASGAGAPVIVKKTAAAPVPSVKK